MPSQWNVVHASRGGSQAHLLVRGDGASDPVPPGWEAHPLTLEELTLAYLREPGAAALPGPARAGTPTIGGNEMTTLHVRRARRRRTPSPRPLPWRRMAWVTWRQHRFALAGVAALLGALALYLWIAGLQLHHAYAAATACHPASSTACGT